jgi:hypothetical protein
MRATMANMRKYGKGPGVFAYSPVTGERCSADPADYWWMGPNESLIDGAGGTMELVFERRTIRRIRRTDAKA